MSNIFNQLNVKTNVLDFMLRKYAGATPTDGNLLKIIMEMATPIPPAESTVDIKNLYASMKDLRIPVYKPREIPETVKVSASDVFDEHLKEVFPTYEAITLILPVGETGFIPTYMPGHKTMERNKKMLHVLAYYTANLIQEDPSNTDALMEDITYAAEIYRTKVFSSGTLSGQINRVRQGLDVARGLRGNHKNKSFKELGVTIVTVADLLYDTLPLSMQDPDIPLIDKMSDYLNSEQQQIIMGTDEKASIPPIAAQSKAGLPFIGRTKGEVSIETILECDNIITETSMLIKQNLFTRTKGSFLDDIARRDITGANDLIMELVKLWGKDYWYLMCGILFPKAERYEASTLDVKTRNIWSAPYTTHMIANQISYYPMKHSLNCLTSTKDTPSLSKFSALQGNIDLFIEVLMAKDGIQHYIYSDNIYMYYPDSDTWYSLDLTKGEANITREFAMATAYYLLTCGWSTTNGVPLFNATWALLAMVLVPLATVESLALLKNLQFRNPGQGSGNAWTFINNHVASTLLCYYWKKMGQPEPSAAMVEKLASATGIDFKIELTVPDFIKSLKNLKENKVLISDSKTHRKFVKMDMLGWDVTYTEYGYTPVLAKERLFASAICPQAPGSTFNEPNKKMVHNYIQSFALYSVGGWAYPAMCGAIKEYTENYWLAIKHKVEIGATTDSTMAGYMAKEIEISSFNDFLKLILPDEAPHLQDWAYIYYGSRTDEVTLQDPKTPRRQILVDLGILDLSPRARAIKILKARKDGTFYRNQSFEKLKQILATIAPGKVSEEVEKTIAGIGDYLTTPRKTVERLEKDGFPSEYISKTWENLLTGRKDVLDITPYINKDTVNNIDVNTLEMMKFLAPSGIDRQIISQTIFATVVGATVPMTKENIRDVYAASQKQFNKSGYSAMVERQTIGGLAAGYIGNATLLLDGLQHIESPPNIKGNKPKKPEEAINPFVAFGIPSNPRLGVISGAGGYSRPRTATEKRRDKRTKALNKH